MQNIKEITQSHTENDFTPNRIILATSTDPAAMVGAYRTLKNIVEKLGEDTAITLLFIGTDHESAGRAFNRIASAAHGFLNRTISCLAVLPKMEPVRMTHLGVFPYRESDNPLNNFTLKMCQAIDNANLFANSTTEANEAISFDNEIPEVNEEDILDTIDLNEPPTNKPDTAIEENDLTNNHRTAPPQLLSMIPELTDLIARSPKAPDVELAIDTDGCIHALYTDIHDDLVDDEDNSNPVASLLSVCDWIETHSNIIRLLRSFPASQSSEMEYSTCSSSTPHHAKPLLTQAHIFTAHPQQYRRLMDGRLRIHLLAPVEEIIVDTENRNTNHPDTDRRQPRWVHVPVN